MRKKHPLIWILSGVALCVVLVLVVTSLMQIIAPITGGKGAGKTDGKNFDFYQGPILPLTIISDSAGVKAGRELTFDFSTFAKTMTGTTKVLHVTDQYRLENTSAEAKTVRLAFPFTGYLSKMAFILPSLKANGKSVSGQIHAGPFLDTIDQDKMNWDRPTNADAFLAALADDEYLEQALAGHTVKRTDPITVYSFSDLDKPTTYGDASTFGLNAIIDPAKTTILAFGLSGASYGETGAARVSGWLFHEEDGIVVALGEPLKAIELKGYTDGGCSVEIEGFQGKVHERKESLQEMVRQQVRMHDEQLAKGSGYQGQPLDEVQQKQITDAEYQSVMALLERSIADPVDRYSKPVIHMESLMTDAFTMTRIFYLVTEISIPAYESIDLTAVYDRSPSQNHFGSKKGGTGQLGFDLLTVAGSALTTDNLTANLILPDSVEIGLQNMGFKPDTAGMGVSRLDPAEPRYFIVINEK